MRRITSIIMRLFIYSISLAFSIGCWTALILLLTSSIRGADIPVLPWTVNVQTPHAYAISLYRGESVILEPTFYQGSDPLPLSGVYETILRYRDSSLADGYYYAITGTVHDATNGALRFPWASTNDAGASIYTYTIAAKSASGTMLRANGVIKMQGTVTGNETNQPPQAITTFDWATVEHLNPEAAPFAGPADILAINQRLNTNETAIADITNRITIIESDYLQSTDLTPYAQLATATFTGPVTATTFTATDTITLGGVTLSEWPTGGGSGGGTGDITSVQISASTGLTGSKNTLSGDHIQTLAIDTATYNIITNSVTNSYAKAMDQHLSTTGTPTFAAATLSSNPVAGVAGTITFDGARFNAALNDDVTLQLGEELIGEFYNVSGGTITNGQAVYMVGEQGDKITIDLATVDIAKSSRAFLGLATEDIQPEESGKVTVFGLVRGISDSLISAPAGSDLYLNGTAGQVTTNETDVYVGKIGRVYGGHVDVLVNPVYDRTIIDLTSNVSGVLPIANGGTGASSASDARDNLGLIIGLTVQPYDADTVIDGDILQNGLSFPSTGLKVKDLGGDTYTTLSFGDDDQGTVTINKGTGNRTLTIQESDVTVTAFGASLVNDTSAAAARTTLDVPSNADLAIYATGTPVYVESDPLSIKESTTYTSWTNIGGVYSQNLVIATSPLLTNGFESVLFDSTGNLSVYAQTSTNMVDWVNAAQTSDPVYLRILVTNDIPLIGDPLHAVSNIIAQSWSQPYLYGYTNDTAGQQILIDTPTTDRSAASKLYVDQQISNINAAGWSKYQALNDVYLSENKLILGYGYALHADENGAHISIHNQNALSIKQDSTGVEINSFIITSNTVQITVNTNGVTSEPYPQFTPTLFPFIDWQNITNYTGSYPIATNGTYTISFPHQGGEIGYYRIQQNDGPIKMQLDGTMLIQGTDILGFITKLSNTVENVTNTAALTYARLDGATFTGPVTNTARTTLQSEVGVGTEATGDALTVKASGDGDGITVRNSNGVTIATIKQNAAGSAYIDFIRPAGALTSRLHSDGNSYFMGGNLGVKTTASSIYELDVAGDIRATGVLTGVTDVVASGTVTANGFVAGPTNIVAAINAISMGSGFVQTNHTGDVSIDGTLTVSSYPAVQTTSVATVTVAWDELHQYMTPADQSTITFPVSPVDFNSRLIDLTVNQGTNSVTWPSTNLPHFAWSTEVDTDQLTNDLINVILSSMPQSSNVVGRIVQYE